MGVAGCAASLGCSAMSEVVQDEVVRRYALLDQSSWPAPRGPMESPRDEEYSRVTDPGRYEVLLARARVWREVLRDRVGRTLSEVPAPLGSGQRAAERAVLLQPPTSVERAQPFWLLEHDGRAGDGLVAGVEIALGETGVLLGQLPHCGCVPATTGAARCPKDWMSWCCTRSSPSC
ncbi:DUF6226 family protein [Serinicoccus marinus]|uniref:DUF6226 family protein n=1 Tax=Serinicoccus marinus TaxID=247333 RepID=UPI003B50DECD